MHVRRHRCLTLTNPARRRYTIPIIKRAYGFTVVELLIVIVVIGILAALAIGSYNSMSAKARDSQRMQDVKAISKALEAYYIRNGEYPPSTGPSVINSSRNSSVDSSWQNLAGHLAPFMKELPVDPTNSGSGISASGHGYAYYSNGGPGYCGATSPRQFFLLGYNLEVDGPERRRETSGECTDTKLGEGYQDFYRAIRK